MVALSFSDLESSFGTTVSVTLARQLFTQTASFGLWLKNLESSFGTTVSVTFARQLFTRTASFGLWLKISSPPSEQLSP